jgi:hypothetical protein
VVRVDADTRERELAHVGAAKQRRPGAAQACNGGAVGSGGFGVGQHHRAGCGRFALHVEQVLHAHGQTGERGKRIARGNGRVRRRRRCACGLSALQNENVPTGGRIARGIAVGESCHRAAASGQDVVTCRREVEGHAG